MINFILASLVYFGFLRKTGGMYYVPKRKPAQRVVNVVAPIVPRPRIDIAMRRHRLAEFQSNVTN